jgi:hypothetical protein
MKRVILPETITIVCYENYMMLHSSFSMIFFGFLSNLLAPIVAIHLTFPFILTWWGLDGNGRGREAWMIRTSAWGSEQALACNTPAH